MNNPWTETAIARLRELWPDPGMSAAKIADEIRGVSRSAVIGKASRLGLGDKPSNSPQATHRLPQVRKPRPYKPKPVRNFGSVFGPYPADKAPEPFVPRVVVLPSLEIPLDDWRDDRCKYIAGDDMLACGHPVKPDKPYCPGHCEIAYRQKTERSEAQKANDARMADRGRAIIKTRAPHKFMVEEVA